MKIQVLSDFHINYHIGRGWDIIPVVQKTDADVVALAGDMNGYYNIIEYLINLRKYCGKPIIFVAGNHEFYGTKRGDLLQKFASERTSLREQGIYILEKDFVEIDDVVFIGATGWWDNSAGLNTWYTRQMLNDFNCIHDLSETSQFGKTWGDSHRQFFHNCMKDHKGKKMVCISHHAPSMKSVSPEFVGNSGNTFFSNKWDKMIKHHNPELWIHGHMHGSKDYMIKNTRIVCNPHGYGRENFGFDPTLVIEV